MASSWNETWASSWGDAFGVIAVIPPPVGGYIEQVLVAANTALDTIAGVNVFRHQFLPLKQSQLPAIVLLNRTAADESVVSIGAGLSLHALIVGIELTVTAATGETAGTALNGLYASAVTALTSDTTLGGYVFDVRETGIELVQLDDSRANAASAVAIVNFEIEYTTAESDPYSVA